MKGGQFSNSALSPISEETDEEVAYVDAESSDPTDADDESENPIPQFDVDVIPPTQDSYAPHNSRVKCSVASYRLRTFSSGDNAESTTNVSLAECSHADACSTGQTVRQSGSQRKESIAIDAVVNSLSAVEDLQENTQRDVKKCSESATPLGVIRNQNAPTGIRNDVSPVATQAVAGPSSSGPREPVAMPIQRGSQSCYHHKISDAIETVHVNLSQESRVRLEAGTNEVDQGEPDHAMPTVSNQISIPGTQHTGSPGSPLSLSPVNGGPYDGSFENESYVSLEKKSTSATLRRSQNQKYEKQKGHAEVESPESEDEESIYTSENADPVGSPLIEERLEFPDVEPPAAFCPNKLSAVECLKNKVPPESPKYESPVGAIEGDIHPEGAHLDPPTPLEESPSTISKIRHVPLPTQIFMQLPMPPEDEQALTTEHRKLTTNLPPPPHSSMESPVEQTSNSQLQIRVSKPADVVSSAVNEKFMEQINPAQPKPSLTVKAGPTLKCQKNPSQLTDSAVIIPLPILAPLDQSVTQSATNVTTVCRRLSPRLSTNAHQVNLGELEAADDVPSFGSEIDENDSIGDIIPQSPDQLVERNISHRPCLIRCLQPPEMRQPLLPGSFAHSAGVSDLAVTVDHRMTTNVAKKIQALHPAKVHPADSVKAKRIGITAIDETDDAQVSTMDSTKNQALLLANGESADVAKIKMAGATTISEVDSAPKITQDDSALKKTPVDSASKNLQVDSAPKNIQADSVNKSNQEDFAPRNTRANSALKNAQMVSAAKNAQVSPVPKITQVDSTITKSKGTSSAKINMTGTSKTKETDSTNTSSKAKELCSSRAKVTGSAKTTDDQSTKTKEAKSKLPRTTRGHLRKLSCTPPVFEEFECDDEDLSAGIEQPTNARSMNASKSSSHLKVAPLPKSKTGNKMICRTPPIDKSLCEDVVSAVEQSSKTQTNNSVSTILQPYGNMQLSLRKDCSQLHTTGRTLPVCDELSSADSDFAVDERPLKPNRSRSKPSTPPKSRGRRVKMLSRTPPIYDEITCEDVDVTLEGQPNESAISFPNGIMAHSTRLDETADSETTRVTRSMSHGHRINDVSCRSTREQTKRVLDTDLSDSDGGAVSDSHSEAVPNGRPAGRTAKRARLARQSPPPTMTETPTSARRGKFEKRSKRRGGLSCAKRPTTSKAPPVTRKALPRSRGNENRPGRSKRNPALITKDTEGSIGEPEVTTVSPLDNRVSFSYRKHATDFRSMSISQLCQTAVEEHDRVMQRRIRSPVLPEHKLRTRIEKITGGLKSNRPWIVEESDDQSDPTEQMFDPNRSRRLGGKTPLSKAKKSATGLFNRSAIHRSPQAQIGPDKIRQTYSGWQTSFIDTRAKNRSLNNQQQVGGRSSVTGKKSSRRSRLELSSDEEQIELNRGESTGRQRYDDDDFDEAEAPSSPPPPPERIDTRRLAHRSPLVSPTHSSVIPEKNDQLGDTNEDASRLRDSWAGHCSLMNEMSTKLIRHSEQSVSKLMLRPRATENDKKIVQKQIRHVFKQLVIRQNKLLTWHMKCTNLTEEVSKELKRSQSA